MRVIEISIYLDTWWGNNVLKMTNINFCYDSHDGILKPNHASKISFCAVDLHNDSWVRRIYAVGKRSHCPQALYFTAENASFHCGFSYQSFSAKCENCFSQISTKVTSDRVQNPQLLCARWGTDEPQAFFKYFTKWV